MAEPHSRPESASRPPSVRVPEDSPESDSHAGPTGSHSPLPQTVLSQADATLAEDAGRHRPLAAVLKTFGRYELLEELARGGMGVVYTARDTSLGRIVALKTMHAEPVPEQVERFHREARAVARLDHPHVVPIYDVGRHGNEDYFAMGFMPGGSLDRHRKQFQEPRAAAVLIEKIARAVHYVHEHGILHRDLKPGNILFDEHGEPRVSDFGLAKFRDGEVEITQPGAVLGTPAYMAPEQARGQTHHVGTATDVWALGVILFELLAGRRPFEAGGPQAVVSMICTEEPSRLRNLRPALDRDLETVTLKCLEKKPQDRYASAAALADDLGRWLAGESVVARPPSLTARSKRWARRHPVVVTASALVAIFLALVLVLLPAANVPGDTEPTLDQLQQVRKGLESGGPLELIAPQGLPKWYHRIGNPELNHPDGESGVLVLKGFELGALELLPEGPGGRYRLSAEVNVVQKSKGGAAGVYVAGRQWPAADGGLDYWWVSLTVPHDDANPHAAVTLRRCRAANVPGGSNKSKELRVIRLPALAPGRQHVGDWRRLQLDVSPGEIVAYWEGERFKRISSADIDKSVAELTLGEQNLPELPRAQDMLGGGLGLYNEGANTRFRKVIVEQLR